MKQKLIAVLTAIILILTTAALAACQQGNPDTTEGTQTVAETVTTAAEETTAAEPAAVSVDQGEAVITTANITSEGMIDATDIFTDRDLRQTADLSEAVSYTLEDGKDVTVTSAGVYVISGSAKNASVIIDADDKDKVQLVLNSVSITNDSTPAIYVKNADKVFVTTVKDTENSLTVSGSFTADGDTNTDAVIFSKDDLTLNGLGVLNISSTDNAVSCKDDLTVTGGAYTITCGYDALEANDSISIADGTFTINTGKDGLHAENDEDNSTGYIYICGGSFDITASSDGIQGTTIVQIDGGTFDISGSEGVEATYIQINGGTVNISATDDGINGSQKSSAYTPTVEINDGNITISMGQGDTDGIDVNGNLYINGGTVDVTCNSPFDYDGVAEHNGGTIIANGTETDTITNQMMGGSMGGPGGMQGGMQGDQGGMQGGRNGGMDGFGY